MGWTVRDVEDLSTGILDLMFQEQGYNQQDLESYNQFITSGMLEIISEQMTIVNISEKTREKHIICLDNLRFMSPTFEEHDKKIHKMDPYEARMRYCSYVSRFMMDVRIYVYRAEPHEKRTSLVLSLQERQFQFPWIDRVPEVVWKQPHAIPPSFYIHHGRFGPQQEPAERLYYREIKDMCMGLMPVALRSVLCTTRYDPKSAAREPSHDHGGSFIINGYDKQLIPTDKMKSNFPYVALSKNQQHQKLWLVAEIRPFDAVRKKTVGSVGVRTTYPQDDVSLLADMTLDRRVQSLSKCKFTCVISSISDKQDIPLTTVCRAMGFCTVDEIVEQLWGNDTSMLPPPFTRDHLVQILAATMNDNAEVTTQVDALEYIGKRMEKIKETVNLHISGTAPSFFPSSSSSSSSQQQPVVISEATARQLAAEKRVRAARHKMRSEFMAHADDLYWSTDPHQYMSESECFARRMASLAYLFRRLVRVMLGMAECDDRDHVVNKRVKATGHLIAELIRNHWRHMMKETRTLLQKAVDGDKRRIDSILNNQLHTTYPDEDERYAVKRVGQWFSHRRMSEELRRHFSSGDWAIKSRSKGKNSSSAIQVNVGTAASGSAHSGVSQTLNRSNRLSLISNARRVTTPIPKEQKHARPRLVHGSQFGVLCPSETPEGPTCGLVKNLTVSSMVSLGYPSEMLTSWIKKRGMVGVIPLSSSVLSGGVGDVGDVDGVNTNGGQMAKVFVNGTWIGYHPQPVEFVDHLRQARRACSIHTETSVAYVHQENEVILSTDSGRLQRPLIRLDRLVQWLSDHLLGGRGSGRQEAVKWIQHILDFSRSSRCRRHRPSHTRSYRQDNVYYPFGFRDLVSNGLIEYIDTREEMTLLVLGSLDRLPEALEQIQQLQQLQQGQNHRLGFSHIEIDPTTVIGFSCAAIPLLQCNQAPRNAYQAAMGKQANPAEDGGIRHRMDTYSRVLHNAQRPMMTTNVASMIGVDECPAGANVVIAVMSYTGDNMEDALICNKASIQRQLFHTDMKRTHRDKLQRVGANGRMETFEKPNPNECMKLRSGESCYQHLDADGLVEPGTRVEEGDAIIGKTMMMCNKKGLDSLAQNIVKRDVSTVLRSGEGGVVENVMITRNADGMKSVKVAVRTYRQPVVGDKFSSRHGQKGTIGRKMPQEDMPFICTGRNAGMTPDLIMNVNGYPGRMTMAQLFEMFFSLEAAMRGEIADGSPFKWTIDTEDEISSQDIREIQTSPLFDTFRDLLDVEDRQRLLHDTVMLRRMTKAVRYLKSIGMATDGKEVMCNGMTGEMIEARIFVGIANYQCLKHQVVDKMHARSRGPVQVLTRQPMEGRARDGGLRFGEMERDAMIAHGAAGTLVDRIQHSDPYVLYIHRACGRPVDACKDTEIPYCKPCSSTEGIVPTPVSYAFKLIQQELAAMNISLRAIL